MVSAEDTDWDRYAACLFEDPDTGLTVDVSPAGITTAHLDDLAPSMADAFTAMAALERGSVANADEGRAVGHYWLRAPDLAPDREVAAAIKASLAMPAEFASLARAEGWRTVLHVGIGGSTTGPQLLCDAWSDPTDGLEVRFLDNADPDGVDRALRGLPGGLRRTAVSVVSKSGITPTPWEVVRELERAYRAADVDFASRAVATTMAGSALAAHAADNGWRAVFPLWDWVGGRTSITSLVGLLPVALVGADTGRFLSGAAAVDALTRVPDLRRNPAALLAAAWHHLGNGRGDRTMVVLPYRDRLALLPKWVQQLVMESLGKEHDRGGRVVRQGLTVHGHKGVTDQHSYLQQLKDGRDDSFVTFVAAHRGGRAPGTGNPDLASHLFSGLVGTLEALARRGRPAVVITVPDYRERSLGALVALFERAVGLYAELIDVNAYHQPGVDKNAALPVLALRREALAHLAKTRDRMTAGELAAALGCDERAVTVHRLMTHLATACPGSVGALPGGSPADTRFYVAGDVVDA
ncbi:MAG: glucose-6-phosphate isomerase [Saccharothrix sp.]|nr:glucose-6-phosphate isomerase [Saccharothrix sp.]